MTSNDIVLPSVYSKDNYQNKFIDYVRNISITEYDLKSAGMNILTEMGYFTHEYRDYLLTLDKKERHVTIGKKLRGNEQMTKALSDGFTEARRVFLTNNNVSNSQLLTIKKDAIFLIDNENANGKVTDLINFNKKETYNSFIRIAGREHYYSLETDELTVKGYPAKVIEYQKEYIFKMIKDLMKLDLADNKDAIFLELASIKHDLINYNLPKQFYMDLRNGAYFFESGGTLFGTEYEILDSVVPALDLNTTLNLLVELIKKLL